MLPKTNRKNDEVKGGYSSSLANCGKNFKSSSSKTKSSRSLPNRPDDNSGKTTGATRHYQFKPDTVKKKPNRSLTSQNDNSNTTYSPDFDLDQELDCARNELNRLMEEREETEKAEKCGKQHTDDKTERLDRTYDHIHQVTPRAANENSENIETSFSNHIVEEKLHISEIVARKLYSKNLSLEKEVATLKKQLNNTGRASESDSPKTNTHAFPIKNQDDVCVVAQRPSTSRPATVRPGTTANLDRLLSSYKQGADHFKFLLETKERTIEDLSKQVAMLQHKVQNVRLGDGCSSMGLEDGDSSTKQQLKRALEDNDRIASNYKQIKDDYQRLLNMRSHFISRDPNISPHAQQLISQLEHRLAVEEQEREAESAAYNTKLHEAEKLQCQAFVEKKMMEHRLKQVARDSSKRDKLESKIEGMVTSMLERMQIVEAENAQLRELEKFQVNDMANPKEEGQ